MYERFGFRPAGHRRRYYHDNGEDALIMWLGEPGALGRWPSRGVILAIETSCDDTCAAVVDGAADPLSNVISSQAAAHARFGGVVPEVASRHHLELDQPGRRRGARRGRRRRSTDVDAIAVTRGPGLIGALLVGVSTAKALAAATGKPLIRRRPPARATSPPTSSSPSRSSRRSSA